LTGSLKSSVPALICSYFILLEQGSSKAGIVEIIVIGNELLNGTVLDTNSHWLAKRLDKIGVTISRKTTVRDDLAVISKAFRESLEREPDWIFSLGGLGPTFDDLTLQGLAKTLGRKIRLNATALKYLRESRKRRLGTSTPRLPKASLKMAMILEGSTPLPNPVGSAPAVLVEQRSTRIVSLPGVPKEMKGIFKGELLPLLRNDFAHLWKRKQVWISSVGVRESEIAPFTLALMRRFSPYIYLKSHPMGFDRKGRSLLRFQLISTNIPLASSTSSKTIDPLEAAAKALEKKIANFSGKSLRISSSSRKSHTNMRTLR
jgi:nicotinamide-nucleotide amidase